MSGLDKAASAFDSDMGNGDTSSEDVVTTTDIDSVFPHMRNREEDEIAGGDELPNPAPRTKAKAAAPVEDEDDTEDETLEEVELDEEGNPIEVDEEDDTEGEDEENDDEEETLYEVVIDGEPAQVSLKEMQSGYIRQETFHRRLNKIAEFEGGLRNEATVLLEDRQKAVSLIDDVQKTLDALVPPEPNWDELYAADPVKARKLQKDYEAMKSKRDELTEAKTKAQQDIQAQQAAEYNKWVRTEKARLAQLFPKWTTDPKVMERDVQSMAKTAKAAGFSDDEIANTHDSRMITILNKAAAYDRLMSRKAPVPVKTGGKRPANNGAGRTRTAPKGLARAQQQLQRTGKVEDAAAVFSQFV